MTKTQTEALATKAAQLASKRPAGRPLVIVRKAHANTLRAAWGAK